MSTLVPWRVSSERPQKDLVSLMNWGLQELLTSLLTGINITGNVCSNTSPEEKTHVQESSVLQSEWNEFSVLSEEARFPGYSTPVDTCLIAISRYSFLHYMYNAAIS